LIGIPAILVLSDTLWSLIAITFSSWVIYGPRVEIISAVVAVIFSSLHNEGHVLGYLCQLCAHGGISLDGIEGIQWQITHHGKGMTCHEDIEMTCIIIIRSMIFITIKPCRCNGSLRSILPSMEDVDIFSSYIMHGPFSIYIYIWVKLASMMM